MGKSRLVEELQHRWALRPGVWPHLRCCVVRAIVHARRPAGRPSPESALRARRPACCSELGGVYDQCNLFLGLGRRERKAQVLRQLLPAWSSWRHVCFERLVVAGLLRASDAPWAPHASPRSRAGAVPLAARAARDVPARPPAGPAVLHAGPRGGEPAGRHAAALHAPQRMPCRCSSRVQAGPPAASVWPTLGRGAPTAQVVTELSLRLPQSVADFGQWRHLLADALEVPLSGAASWMPCGRPAAYRACRASPSSNVSCAEIPEAVPDPEQRGRLLLEKHHERGGPPSLVSHAAA